VKASIWANIVANSEVSSGERRSGTDIAIDKLVYKVGLAPGVGLSFYLLDLVGYNPSVELRVLIEADPVSGPYTGHSLGCE
jgi:Na+/melibiose symporter-like transporter